MGESQSPGPVPWGPCILTAHAASLLWYYVVMLGSMFVAQCSGQAEQCLSLLLLPWVWWCNHCKQLVVCMRPEHIGALGCQRWANGWCSAPHLLLYCTSIFASGLLVVLWCGQGVALHRQSKTAGVLGSLHAQSDVAASARVRPYLLTKVTCGCRQAVLGFFVGCAY